MNNTVEEITTPEKILGKYIGNADLDNEPAIIKAMTEYASLSVADKDREIKKLREENENIEASELTFRDWYLKSKKEVEYYKALYESLYQYAIGTDEDDFTEQQDFEDAKVIAFDKWQALKQQPPEQR